MMGQLDHHLKNLVFKYLQVDLVLWTHNVAEPGPEDLSSPGTEISLMYLCMHESQ